MKKMFCIFPDTQILSVRTMQIKTRCHFTPKKLADIKNNKNNPLGVDSEEIRNLMHASGNATGPAFLEKNMDTP